MFPRFPSPVPVWTDAKPAPERFARLRRLSLALLLSALPVTGAGGAFLPRQGLGVFRHSRVSEKRSPDTPLFFNSSNTRFGYNFSMDYIGDFSDRRHKGSCIHCGSGLFDVKTNQDHVPSKSLLEEPYPPELPTIEICTNCNTSFSHDEEYFAAFLGAVLTGSTEPEAQNTATAASIFRHSKALRKRVDAQRQNYTTLGGEQRIVWNPELDRVRNIIVKNARGHVYYELGQPAFGEPSNVGIWPLENLSEIELERLLTIDHGPGWPEVGCRMMTRLLTGQDMEDGWIVVQDGIYRFAAVENDGFLVRSIIREYIAAEVFWEY